MRIQGVNSDSRRIEGGELFVPLKGPNFDGHRFVGEALAKGAAGSLVGHDREDVVRGIDSPGKFLIAVDDPLMALGDLARDWRRRFPRVKVVAVTGSNGKTTTKEMAARILEGAFRILQTEGNLNNWIGLPLTLLKLSPEHELAVLEMGMNLPGEIRRLKEIAEPQVSLITNIGRAHLEFLGSMEGVARAKGELWEGLKPEDWIAVNRDDPRVANLASAVHCRKKSFAIRERAEVRAEEIGIEAGRGIRFSLLLSGEKRTVRLKAFGEHNVYNALGAACLASILGLGLEEVAAGLEKFQPYAGRGRVLHLGRNLHLLDDTYNSNPDSLGATLAAFAGMKEKNRGSVVLGDMLELGPGAAEFHLQAGKRAGEVARGHLFFLGDQRDRLAEGARSAGAEEARVHTPSTPEEAVEGLEEWMEEGDWLLVKGSRRMRMERIVEALVDRLGKA